MKRIYSCMGIFAVLVVFSFACENYVSKTVKQTKQLLVLSAESRSAGDYSLSREYIDSAWEKWRLLGKRSNYVVADLTIVADVTVSLSRVVTLSQETPTGGDDRFIEECNATLLLLEHFTADNQNVLGGVGANERLINNK